MTDHIHTSAVVAGAGTPEFTTLTAHVRGRIGRLTLHQPDQLNPLGSTALREIVAAATWFDTQPTIGVVIVSGAGRAFSSGFDLREFAGRGASDTVGRDVADLGRQMADAVEAMAATTIAAIKGPCIGGGVVLLPRAICGSPPTTLASPSRRSTSVSPWRGAESPGWCARSVR
jgi:1,4-dihydroxy-2-naphthoyl-CoA synthase